MTNSNLNNDNEREHLKIRKKFLGKCVICESNDAIRSKEIRYAELEFCPYHKEQFDAIWKYYQIAFFKSERWIDRFKGFLFHKSKYFSYFLLSLIFGLFWIAWIIPNNLSFIYPQYDSSSMVLILFGYFLLVLLKYSGKSETSNHQYQYYIHEGKGIIVSRGRNDSDFLMPIIKELLGTVFIFLNGMVLSEFILVYFLLGKAWLSNLLMILLIFSLYVLYIYYNEYKGRMRIYFEKGELVDNYKIENLYLNYKEEREHHTTKSKNPIGKINTFILGLIFLFLAILSLWIEIYYLTGLFEILTLWFFFYDINIPKVFFKKEIPHLRRLMPVVFIYFCFFIRFSIEGILTSLGLITEGDNIWLQLVFFDHTPSLDEFVISISIITFFVVYLLLLIPKIYSMQIVNYNLAEFRDFKYEKVIQYQSYISERADYFLIINLEFIGIIVVFPIIFGMITSLLVLLIIWIIQTVILARKKIHDFLKIKYDFWRDIFTHIRKSSIWLNLVRWTPLTFFLALASYFWLPKIMLWDFKIKVTGIELIIKPFNTSYIPNLIGFVFMFIPLILLIYYVFESKSITKLSFYQQLYLAGSMTTFFLFPIITPFPFFIRNYISLLALFQLIGLFQFVYLSYWFWAFGRKAKLIGKRNLTHKKVIREIHPKMQSICLQILLSFNEMIMIISLVINNEYFIVLTFTFFLAGIIYLSIQKKNYVDIVLLTHHQKEMQNSCIQCGKPTSYTDITCKDCFNWLDSFDFYSQYGGRIKKKLKKANQITKLKKISPQEYEKRKLKVEGNKIIQKFENKYNKEKKRRK